MKIAIYGQTLQADTLVKIFSRYGHHVHWCCDDAKDVSHDLDCYIFCYAPTEKEKAYEIVNRLVNHHAEGRLMINGSTFGLHGTAELQAILPNNHWAYLPDTIQEGNAIGSFVNAKQAIVGLETDDAKVLIKELLRPMFPLDHQILFMPILDAEFAKLSISGMLATRISYMNDLANVAEKLGVDILNVKQGMAADSRIGSTYLSPGVGFGGENFSQDILTLSSEVSKTGTKSRLLEQVWSINEDQKEILFRKLWNYYQTDLKGKKIAIWGAAFKENTASTHNSPVHKMIQALLAQGVQIQLFDPEANSAIQMMYGDSVHIVENEYDALQDADALCLLTAWQQFYNPDYQFMKTLMNHPLILDGRNIYDPTFMRHQGFIYEGIGRV